MCGQIAHTSARINLAFRTVKSLKLLKSSEVKKLIIWTVKESERIKKSPTVGQIWTNLQLFGRGKLGQNFAEPIGMFNWTEQRKAPVQVNWSYRKVRSPKFCVSGRLLTKSVKMMRPFGAGNFPTPISKKLDIATSTVHYNFEKFKTKVFENPPTRPAGNFPAGSFPRWLTQLV